MSKIIRTLIYFMGSFRLGYESSLVIWVKLTQGTGRGTCLWNKYLLFVLLNFLIDLQKSRYNLVFYEFFNNFNFYFNFKLTSLEEIVIIFLFYNFIKILIFSSLLELIWPTQFFNRRHSNYAIRYRSFVETLTKLKTKNTFYNVFNSSLLKNLFFKN